MQSGSPTTLDQKQPRLKKPYDQMRQSLPTVIGTDSVTSRFQQSINFNKNEEPSRSKKSTKRTANGIFESTQPSPKKRSVMLSVGQTSTGGSNLVLDPTRIESLRALLQIGNIKPLELQGETTGMKRQTVISQNRS